MSELGSPKPEGTDLDLADLEWGTALVSPTPEVETPAPAKRSTGFVDGEEPPFAFFNWAWRLAFAAIVWLSSWHIRAFDQLDSAVASTTQGHTFTVAKPAGPSAMLDPVWAEAGSNAVNDVSSASSDCEFVFYSQGNVIVKANRTTGATITSRDLGVLINRVFSDGLYVYAVTSTNAGSEVFGMSRDDLVDVGSWPVGNTLNVEDVKSNGAEVVTVDGSANANYRSPLGVLLGSFGYGGTLRRCAIDDRLKYIGGDISGGNQIAAYEGAGLVWQRGIGGGAVAILGMSTDGKRVYVCGALGNDAGVQHNVRAYSREDGARVWRTVTPGALSLVWCAVDDRVLWCIDSAGKLFALDASTGELLRQGDHTAAGLGVDTDADSLFVCGVPDGSGDALKRLDLANPSRQYVRALGDDAHRRPFAKLATPTE